MIRKHMTLSALASALALTACASEGTQNIGDVGVLGASLSDYAGSWEGYAEAYEFADGSDKVRLVLNDQGVGVIEVGDTAPLPEPDPELGFPPSGTFPGHDGFMHTASFQGQLAPGFSYPIEAGIVEENRIRFAAASNELYSEWCAGMEPVHDPLNSNQNGNGEVYSCLPNEGVMYPGDSDECVVGDMPISCGKVACISVCQCDANGCAVHAAEPDVRFDGALDDMGEALMGTLVMGERLTLRFARE